MTDARPDPDALLSSLRREEAKARRGRLKVFFGMCPGVGKTYAMLRAGHAERAERRDVVIGLVETHRRAETEALVAGLPLIPRRSVEHRGTTLTEFDLEAVLARRPSLVLVDELAHSNAPGSRHTKRWQDVVELVEAGIDVFTTLNVQHLESRADAVRQITGATVHETVPDSVLDLAEEIELIDLTPAALRERLREGKVYLGQQAAAAREAFFQESHLAALRELALRVTAERVDRQLRELRAGGGRKVVWRSGERLLVAVGPSPFSTQLVRWTRRMSAALGAPWVAVHVETSATLTPEAQARLDKNLSLARELGAEMVITHDLDVAAALVRVARERNATQIVIGKPRGARWLWWLRGGSLVERLARLGGEIDIYMVPGERTGTSLSRDYTTPPLEGLGREFVIVASAIAAVTALSAYLPSQYYLSVGLLYLLTVIGLSLRVGRAPVVVAAVLSALTWNYGFIPPRFTFVISKVEDALLCGTFVAVAVVAGQLTARVRAQAQNERRREERATALFQLTHALAEAGTLDEAIFAALRQAETVFGAQTALALADDGGGDGFVPHFAGSFALDEKERAVAEWVFRNRRRAGRFTDTLPASAGYYVPLVRGEHAVGVLGLIVSTGGALTLAQRDLADAFARQLALSVEQDHLREAGQRETLLAESERLHRALLDSVSHELRTPLAVISGSLESMDGAGPEGQAALVAEMRTASARLNRLVGNLLDQTRLESGALRPRLDWCDLGDVVNAAHAAAKEALAGHAVTLDVPAGLPPVRADFTLTEQALANVLVNAALHTPPGTAVRVTTGVDRATRRAFFTVADRGPGFPATVRERLFKKFSRGDAARAGGLGLGLSIVRGFIVAQGGDVVVSDTPGGGATITLYLPFVEPNAVPAE